MTTTCARCGATLKPEAPRVFSSWTRAYYCANVKKCAKRAKRTRFTGAATVTVWALGFLLFFHGVVA